MLSAPKKGIASSTYRWLHCFCTGRKGRPALALGRPFKLNKSLKFVVSPQSRAQGWRGGCRVAEGMCTSSFQADGALRSPLRGLNGVSLCMPDRSPQARRLGELGVQPVRLGHAHVHEDGIVPAGLMRDNLSMAISVDLRDVGLYAARRMPNSNRLAMLCRRCLDAFLAKHWQSI